MAGQSHRDIFAKDVTWGRGSSDGIQYARLLMDEDDKSSPLVILSKFQAGEVVEPHTHGTNYFEYVLEGQQTVGKVTFGKGDMRLVKAGTGYGPIMIGAEGCTVLIVFQEASGSMAQPKGRAKEAV